jgi:hypothetical protein
MGRLEIADVTISSEAAGGGPDDRQRMIAIIAENTASAARSGGSRRLSMKPIAAGRRPAPRDLHKIWQAVAKRGPSGARRHSAGLQES